MLKAKRLCVKGLTRAEGEAVVDECLVGCCLLTSQNLTTAVAFVGKERMPYVPHVCPYLMSSSCFKVTLHKRDRPEAFQHSIVRDGRFPYLAVHRINIHLQAVFGVAAYVASYGALVVRKRSPHKRIVLALGRMVEELLAQVRLCVRSLRNDQQTACVLVDTMHETYRRVVWVEAFVVAQVPGKSIDERVAIVAQPGCTTRPAGLLMTSSTSSS